MKIKLPFWMNKGELSKISSLFEKWWDLVFKTIKIPLSFLDENTCPVFILNLIAYQRDIKRFKNEPLSLYRQRVKYAFINAMDAGSVQGFINIFKRLGIGYVALQERLPDIDWDIIKIYLTDDQIAGNNELLQYIIRKYGRTCRRYDYEIVTVKGVVIGCGVFGADYQTFYTKLKTTSTKFKYGENSLISQTFVAKLKLPM